MHIWNFIAMLIMIIMAVSADWKIVKRYRGWHEGFSSWTNLAGRDESTVPDQTLCEWKCFNTKWCRKVTFSQVDFSCRLKRKYSTFYYNGNMACETSIVRRQKVYKVNDLTTEPSTWTVPAARNLCAKLDLKLMTYEELDLARDTHNYYTDACGYVEGGIATSPFDDILGMVNCSLTAAMAFCRDQ